MHRVLLAATIAIASASAWAQPKVAVLDAVFPQTMDSSAAVPVAERIIEKLVASGRFTVLDRANVDNVLKEREFQLSGMTNDRDLAAAGKYLGADFIVVARAQEVGDTYFLSAQMITVKTGVIVNQTSAQGEGKPAVLIDLAGQVGEALCGGAATSPGKAPAVAKAEPPAPAKTEPHEAQKYRWNERPGVPIALNLVVGFGVGSFVQKDNLGGAVCVVGDSLACVLYVWGYVDTYASLIESAANNRTWDNSTGRTLLLAGAGVYAATAIFGVIRPIKYFDRLKARRGEVAFFAAPTLATASLEGRTVAQPGAVLSLSF